MAEGANLAFVDDPGSPSNRQMLISCSCTLPLVFRSTCLILDHMIMSTMCQFQNSKILGDPGSTGHYGGMLPRMNIGDPRAG